MAEIFNRDVSLNIGGTRIASRSELGISKPILKLEFKIEKSLQKEPNTAEVSIWNLSKDTRVKMQQKNIPTTIEAGYVGLTSVIFSGDLQYGSSRRDATDWVTHLQAAEGGKQYRSARSNFSFAKNTKIKEVLKKLVSDLGVGAGNALEKISQGSIRGGVEEFLKGAVVSGKTEKEIDKMMKQLGYEWSIQGGQLQVLGPKETLRDQVVLLSPGTGMVGSPEPGDKGIVKVKSVLLADLLPGRRIKIESAEINGYFRIEKATFTGDTWGSAWDTDIEAKPL